MTPIEQKACIRAAQLYRNVDGVSDSKEADLLADTLYETVRAELNTDIALTRREARMLIETLREASK